jgi:hypothetical protein
MTAPLKFCSKDKQHAIPRLLLSEKTKEAEFRCQLTAKHGQNCLPQRSMYKWIETVKNSEASAVDADKVMTHIHKGIKY